MTNRLYCWDNLPILGEYISSKSVDVAYLAPAVLRKAKRETKDTKFKLL